MRPTATFLKTSNFHARILVWGRSYGTASPTTTTTTTTGDTSREPNHSNKVAETPLLEYQRLVSLGRLKNDEYQRKILAKLGNLHQHLKNYHPPKVDIPDINEVTPKSPSIFSSITSLFSRKTAKENHTSEEYQSIPKGLYLWGDVGCGKTMLMDLFYSTVPPHLTKTRVHFHQFMQNLHKRSHQIIIKHGKQDIDPIPILAAEIAQQSTVLCFDEFQVTDVADAMLLRRLISTTLAPSHGLILFATSNREPNDLYINGIQRESFIPAIRLLENRTNVVYLDSPTDYRRIQKPLSSVYFYPTQGTSYHSAESKAKRLQHIDQWFKYFAQTTELDHGAENSTVKINDTIKIWGRELEVPKSIPHTIAQFTFDELCGRPLAAGDYLALASHYNSFIVTDIPYLSINVRDKVRRFITFLDAIYDNHGKLATTGANQFNRLFVDPKFIRKDDEFSLVENAVIHDYSDVKGGSSINNSKNDNDQVDQKSVNGVAQQDATATKQENPAVSLATSKSNRKIQKKLSKEIGSTKVDKNILAQSSQMFSLDEERFAFVRALSRLTQMSTVDWVKYGH